MVQGTGRRFASCATGLLHRAAGWASRANQGRPSGSLLYPCDFTCCTATTGATKCLSRLSIGARKALCPHTFSPRSA